MVERLVYTEWVSGSSPLFLKLWVMYGCMTEWSKVPVLKTGLVVWPTWVQIPLHPITDCVCAGMGQLPTRHRV